MLKQIHPTYPTVQELQQQFGVSYSEACQYLATMRAQTIFRDMDHQVTLSPPMFFPNFPALAKMSVSRLDRKPVDGWDTLQAIKNEIIGAEFEAVEVFPAESRLVNMGNERHLWVFLDENYRLPFGWTKRMVNGEGS